MTPTAPKRPVIVGASGMVGGHALRYALENPSVSGVTAIGRRKLGISDPKLSEVLHQDFADCSALAEALSGQDAAVFCLGTYTGVVPDAELRTITVDYTVEFARVLRGRSRCDGAGANAVNVRDGGCSVSLRGKGPSSRLLSARGVLEVGGTDVCVAEEVAHVVEGHDDHHEAAQHVDGSEPGSGVRARGRLDDDRPVAFAHRHQGVRIAARGSCVETTRRGTYATSQLHDRSRAGRHVGLSHGRRSRRVAATSGCASC